MNESSQAIVAVKREVQLSEWQRQVQERQEQGISVLRSPSGSDQGTHMGGRRISSPLQTFGQRVFRWPRNEMEARLLTEQEIRWLLEGLELEQPKAIKESKPGILY